MNWYCYEKFSPYLQLLMFNRQSSPRAVYYSMYIRFETEICFRGTSYRKGIFAAMGDLKRSQKMSEEEIAWYANIAEWFNKTLLNPTCFDPPIADGIKFRAKSWFSVSATEFISQSRAVVDLLTKYGVVVTELRSEKPGKILYEDNFQIVVLP